MRIQTIITVIALSLIYTAQAQSKKVTSPTQVTKTILKSTVSNKPVSKALKVYPKPELTPVLCRDLPQFKYNEDSTQIIYNTDIAIGKVENPLERIRSDVYEKAFFNVDFIRPGALDGSYFGIIDKNQQLLAKVLILLNKEGKGLIALDSIKVYHLDTKVTEPIEKIRANLYSPENSTQVSKNCEALIDYDQRL